MKRDKRMMLRLCMGIFIVAAVVMSTTGTGTAQTQEVLSYAAKFVCFTGNALAVVPGTYLTTINIHNPHTLPVTIKKKAVLALPERASRGEISPFVTETLGPDEAMGVDCKDIKGLFPKPPVSFIEGFVVIQVAPQANFQTAPELDVVGVYTAKHRTGTDINDPKKYDVESIDVKEYSPKKILQ